MNITKNSEIRIDNSFPQQAHYKKNEDGTYMIEFNEHLIDKDGYKYKGMIKVPKCNPGQLPNDEGTLLLKTKASKDYILSCALIDEQSTIYELIVPDGKRSKVTTLFKRWLKNFGVSK